MDDLSRRRQQARGPRLRARTARRRAPSAGSSRPAGSPGARRTARRGASSSVRDPALVEEAAQSVYASDNVRGAPFVVAIVIGGKGPTAFDAGRAAQNMMLAASNDGHRLVPERRRRRRAPAGGGRARRRGAGRDGADVRRSGAAARSGRPIGAGLDRGRRPAPVRGGRRGALNRARSCQNARGAVPIHARSASSRPAGPTVACVKLAALVLIACLSLASSAPGRAPGGAPSRGRSLRPFAVAADRYARGQHRGVDLGAPPGADVRAACAGRVRFAGARAARRAHGERRLRPPRRHVPAARRDRGRRGQVVLAGARIGAVGPLRRSARAATARAPRRSRCRDRALRRSADAVRAPGRAHCRRCGPAPRRRTPLGPAPLRPVARHAVPRPVVAPVAADPVRAPRGAPAPALPVIVWIGLAAFGLGLPLGGLVARRRAPSTACDAPEAGRGAQVA